jgi:transcriptional regulator with XRE-family HTH domain
MTNIAPSSTDHSKAEALLAQAQENFPGFSLFGDFNQSAYVGQGINRLGDFFAKQSSETKKALTDYVMTKAKQQSFGEMMRALRIVNGSGTARLAEITYSKSWFEPRITNIERDGAKLPFERLQYFLKSNPFDLDEAQKEILQRVWEKTYDQPLQTESEIIAEAQKQLAEYLAGKRPLNGTSETKGLMTRNDLIAGIFAARQQDACYRNKPEYQSYAAFSRHCEKLRDWFATTLDGHSAFLDASLNTILDGMGVDNHDELRQLLLKLPYERRDKDRSKSFGEAERAHMVKLEVAKLFDQPQYYHSAGEWLRALREAAYMTRDEVGQGLGDRGKDLSVQSIEQWEKNTASPSASAIEKLIQTNRYSLPTNLEGNISKASKKKFRTLATAGNNNWIARVKKTEPNATIRLRDAYHYMASEKISAASWQAYVKQEIMPELEAIDTGSKMGDADRFSITLEGRQLNVIRKNDEAFFSWEEIVRLTQDRHFMQRLEKSISRLEKQQGLGSQEPSRG